MGQVVEIIKEAVKKYTTWLALGTWALFFGGILSIYIVKHSYDKQLKEMQDANDSNRQSYSELLQEIKKATEMEWRPYLHVEHVGYRFDAVARLGETPNEDTVFRSLREIPVDGEKWMALKTVGWVLNRLIRLRNSGKTPLRVSKSLASAISESEWTKEYQESIYQFAEEITNLEAVQVMDKDIIILPDSSYQVPGSPVTSRRMYKDEFAKKIDLGKMAVFPYTYVEYEDFFGHVYNTLLMEETIIYLGLKDGYVSIADSIGVTPEKYRWDIAIGE